MAHGNVALRIWRFYRDGFRSMTWGRVLWLIIIVKLVVMFGVLRLFFFPDYLSRAGDDAVARRRRRGQGGVCGTRAGRPWRLMRARRNV